MSIEDVVTPVNNMLADLIGRRGRCVPSGHSHNMVELNGGTMVEALAFPPDPETHRSPYYYNATTNVLYKRVVTINHPSIGLLRAHWQRVSN